jgi:hypothetical protein
MKLVKSLLLGSAAGLCAVAGAQAADLPMRKSAPVEYVRVCTAYGAGFFYIPGTDTCIRVGGRARFEYQYTSQNAKNASTSGFRGLGRLNLDARTQTPYGTLRAFVRFEIASRTGGYLTSGSQQRNANAFNALGQDQFGNNQKYVDVDKAFVQFMGFTAGRAASFFDFYAHDVEIIGTSIGSDVSATNLFAYTATFGGGFSATLSVEDPVFRRNATFGATLTTVNGITTAATTPINAYNAAGVLVGSTNLDVVQKTKLPDFVGVLRYDQPWGSAQLSGAVHEVNYGVLTNPVGGVGAGIGAIAANRPDSDYGYAVQGGLKLNVPQLAPGDVLWLQAAYADGANNYTGQHNIPGFDLLASGVTNKFTIIDSDAAVDQFGRSHTTTSYSGTIAFLHYWTPEWRQAVFGSYGRSQFDGILRTAAGPAGAQGIFSSVFKDYSQIYVGSNLIWSPVRDLDIGVEGVYQRIETLGGVSNGRVYDLNKGGAATGRVTSADDQVLVRMRVQRDF